MYYCILTNPERRQCIVTIGATTEERAHQQAHKARPADWSGLDYTTRVVEAASRYHARESSPEARSWATT